MINSLKDCPTSEQLEGVVRKNRRRRDYFHILKNTVFSLVVAAAVAVIISVLLFPVLRITGKSMTPSLMPDELVVCRRKSDYKRGDIIAFYFNNKILVKRVVALSGDVVEIKDDGTLNVNGYDVDEPYVSEKALGECDIEMPYTVPEQKVFVMGDDRSVSIDSRSEKVGCVSEEEVVGKVIFRLWPFKKIGKI